MTKELALANSLGNLSANKVGLSDDLSSSTILQFELRFCYFQCTQQNAEPIKKKVMIILE
jgi:hypothetical protein